MDTSRYMHQFGKKTEKRAKIKVIKANTNTFPSTQFKTTVNQGTLIVQFNYIEELRTEYGCSQYRIALNTGLLLIADWS